MRKERLSPDEWLKDWYGALHFLGWTCRNEGINPNRKRLTQEELSKIEVLFLQKENKAVYLHPTIETVPQKGLGYELWDGKTPRIKTAIRIVKGRRPDQRRAAVRLKDGTATRIVPNNGSSLIETFFVDFDGGLFESTGRGDWQLAQGEESQLYAAYREASPHLRAFRKYDRTPKLMVPHLSPLGCGSFAVDKKLDAPIYQ